MLRVQRLVRRVRCGPSSAGKFEGALARAKSCQRLNSAKSHDFDIRSMKEDRESGFPSRSVKAWERYRRSRARVMPTYRTAASEEAFCGSKSNPSGMTPS